jgi:hypothetical protein
MQHNVTFILVVVLDQRKSGIGRRVIIMSEDMLRVALVIRWFLAVAHCSR